MFNTFYRIVHRATGLVLYANHACGVHLDVVNIQDACQVWCVSDDVYNMTSLYNVGVDVSLDGCAAGEEVSCTADNANNPYQRWVRRASRDKPYYTIVHTASGCVLEASRPDRVVLHPSRDGHPSQDWYFVLLD